ncbi:hypothetical protein DRO97_06470 [Archaeoglobales archaeon]|nr:MAG: hypothetical protein DRO97_06470 [Archaeoglobales archaeon]
MRADDVVKIIKYIFIIGVFIYLTLYLIQLKSKLIPAESPWARTTPIDPVIPIVSLAIAAFIFLKRSK